MSTDDVSSVKHMMTIGMTSPEIYGQVPRIQALRLIEHIEREGWKLVKVTSNHPPHDGRDWPEYQNRIKALLDAGIATTRTRTSAALAELGLHPPEIRAAVIEPNVIHVFRYSESRQTLPIIEETP